MRKLKKTLILICLLMVTMFSVCSAKDNDRWYWLTSTDTETTYVDSYRIYYNKQYDTVECFLMVQIPSENRIELIRTFFNYQNGTYTYYEGYIYDMSENLVAQVTNPETSYIMPDTVAEEWAVYISYLAGRTK